MAGLRVKDIMDYMESLAPSELAESYDNVGLLVGSSKQEVKRIMVGLELTDDLLQQGIEKKCDMILVHHPLIFKPLKQIVTGDAIQERVIRLIKEDISLYVAHTNLDMTLGGLNDFIAEKLGIAVTNVTEEEPIPPIRIGRVNKQSLKELILQVKENLNLNYIHYCGDDHKSIKKVGLCTGSGISFYKEAVAQGVDAYITGDIKYHDATMADDLGVPIIDATHFGSEVMVKELFYNKLKEKFEDEVDIYMELGSQNPIKVL